VPAEPDPHPGPEAGDAFAHGVHDPGDLVPRHARVPDAGPEALLRQRVAVADPRGLHPDPDLPGTGLGNVALDDLERTFGGTNLGGAHPGHRSLPQDLEVEERRLAMRMGVLRGGE
jgi:hypothetical protein